MNSEKIGIFWKSHPFRISSFLLWFILISSCGKTDFPDYIPPEGISWSSVLNETSDINSLLNSFQAWEKSLHFSSAASSDKVMLANLAPEIMGDMDHGFFLDVNEHDGVVDATLAEVEGKGMISWIWSANPTGTLILFIDDKEKPLLMVPFKKFLLGQFLPVPHPFSAFTANGYNLHFPILHNKYCKIVVRMRDKKKLASLFYQIAWNAIDPAQDVNTFSTQDIAQGGKLLKKLADSMQTFSNLEKVVNFKTLQLKGGETTDLFTSAIPGTILIINIQTKNYNSLPFLQFKAYWDAHTDPDIDCPLYMLSGSSEKFENVNSLPVSINDASISIRWPMPFHSARIQVGNISNQTIQLKYFIQTHKKMSHSRLIGRYAKQSNLRTDYLNVYPLAEFSGPGRIVACNIQVKSRTDKWWGEGDQIIYIDSMDKPVWCGTGTEDYFGFAWCSQNTFNHPFRGQSAVWDIDIEKITAMHRYHILDRLPFQNFASFQTEVFGLSKGTLDFESLILCYISK